MAYSAGTVFLQVVPSYRGFQESVRRQAKEAARAFKGEFEKETGQRIADAIDKAGPASKRAAEKLGVDAGRELSGGLRREIDKSITSALKNIPKVKITADSSALDRALDKARTELRTLGKANANLDLDTGSVQAQLAAVVGSLTTIKRLAASGSEVDIDTGSAIADLLKLEAVKAIALKDGTINIDVDSGAATAKLAAVTAQSKAAGASGDDTANSFRAFNGVLLSAVALGPLLVPILAALAGGLAAIGPMAIAAASGLGVVILGLSGIPAAVGALGDVAKNGAKDTLAASKTMRGAANGVRDAERALARAKQDSAQSQADAAARIVEAERNVARARVAAARSTADASRAVAAARRSLADAEKGAADDIENALEAERNARRNLTRAQEDAARAITTANRNLAESQRSLTRAREDAAERTESASRTLANAERRVAKAQTDAADAQRDLLQARRDARQDLEDLAIRAQEGALAEREAILAVADAKKQFDRVMGREFKSARSIEDVTIAYRQAELALESVRLENARTADEVAAAAINGVEGSDRVVAAQERIVDAEVARADAATSLADAQANAAQVERDNLTSIADAVQGVADARTELRRTERDANQDLIDAQRDVREAAENTRDVRAQAARDIIDAERGVTDALREQRETITDNAQSIQDAQRGVADAQLAASRAAVDGAQAVSDAQRRITDAQLAYRDALTSTGDLGSSSMQKLEDAMGKLSPAGQAFALFLYGLKDEFLKLRQAAEEGLLPGLQSFLEMVISTYGPGFTKWVGEMAKVAGDLFVYLGEMLTTNPLWREFFDTFSKISPKLFRQFGETTVNWLTIFVTLMEAFAPLALMASDYLLKLSENLMKWAGGLEDTQGFRDFMDYLERIFPKVGAFLGAFFSALITFAEAIAPFGEILLEVFTGIFNAIAGMNPDTLGAVLFFFGALVIALQAAYGVMTLMLVGITAFQLTVGIWVVAAVIFIAALVALYLKCEKFREIVGIVADFVKTAFRQLGDVIQFVWKNILRPTFEAIGEGLVWLWEKVLSPTFGFIGEAWDATVRFMKRAWEEVLQPTWEAIQTAAEFLWKEILKPIFKFIGGAFETMGGVISGYWNNFLYPLFELFGAIVRTLWEAQLKVVFLLISGAWTVLSDNISYAWEHFMRPAFKALGTVVEAVWDVIRPIFAAIGDVVENVLVRNFENGVFAIGNAWQGLVDASKTPVKFMIETVINKGIIGTFNKVADFFDTKNIPEVPLPKGFASGGYTGRGGRFDPAGIVHRDEYVISSPARRIFESTHPGALDTINATGSMPGYAGGGLVRPVRADYGLPFGNTYSDGSFHSGQDFPAAAGTSVHAALPGIVKSVLSLVGSYGKHVVLSHGGGLETLYAHLSSMGVSVGQRVGAGEILGGVGSTGNSSGNHLHFEFRTPPGGYSNAKDPRPYLAGGPLPKGDGSIFPDWITNPFNFLKGKVTGLFDGLGTSPFGSFLKAGPRRLLGLAGDAIGGFGNQIGDVFGKLNPFGGAGLYDNGGVLPVGMTAALNASGRPEAVLNSAQWAAIERVADGGGAPSLSIGSLVAADPEDAVRKIRTSQQDAASLHNLRAVASGV